MFFAHKNLVVRQILEALSCLLGRTGACSCHVDRGLFLDRVDGCWWIIRLGIVRTFYVLEHGLSPDARRDLIPRIDLLSTTQSMFVVACVTSRDQFTAPDDSPTRADAYPPTVLITFLTFPPRFPVDGSCVLHELRHTCIPPSMSHYGLGAAL